MAYLGRCITDPDELRNIVDNVTETRALYQCTYKKEFLKDPENICSGVNHTKEVDGIYINETQCVEYKEDDHGNFFDDPNKLFDIPFGIRKTGKGRTG